MLDLQSRHAPGVLVNYMHIHWGFSSKCRVGILQLMCPERFIFFDRFLGKFASDLAIRLVYLDPTLGLSEILVQFGIGIAQIERELVW